MQLMQLLFKAFTFSCAAGDKGAWIAFDKSSEHPCGYGSHSHSTWNRQAVFEAMSLVSAPLSQGSTGPLDISSLPATGHASIPALTCLED